MVYRICLADWDGTLRRGYTAQDWLRFLSQSGVTDSYYSDLFDKALQDYSHSKFGYATLVESCCEIYTAALNGASLDEITKKSFEFQSILEIGLFSFTRNLLTALWKAKYEVIVISGAPEEPLLPFFRAFSSFRFFGLKLEINEHGFYTGRTLENNGLRASKKTIVANILPHGANAVLALGNSESDFPLFQRSNIKFYITDKYSPDGNVDFKYLYHDDNSEKVIRELEAL